MLRVLLFLLCTVLSFSQTHTITGVVSDDSNKPLESANVIAKPLQEKASLKFAIADNKGRYRLELDKEVKYEITVSYIGFVEEILFLSPVQPLQPMILNSNLLVRNSKKL
ncbi:carboxypeptidase-like regulatory domain-containing protein [Flavobacterium acetivorans]|uniref:carboxypeptidase-like regulatory domain-containing protein n=1 Tax=Flavobacterium acetivorans TaxID=2893883 RepID=UPI001E44CF32|nr:carboxypeptidase-like regulatory domain-containing protein [Flavobacterium sp. F-29]UFH34649.1 carboxypeptidase-like regulatory domain-containing protein [Flavobacterium sp. F-29]